MLNVYLLRHGETAWNADNNRYCGRTDLALTDNGLRQATAVAQQLKHLRFLAVYASPLKRALLTAQIASERKDVITDDRLIEADFGSWEGKTKEEFRAENEELWQRWLAAPERNRAGGTGETGKEIVDRVDRFFQAVLASHSSGNVLVVAHNGVNRLYLAHKLGMGLRNYRRLFLENSAVSMFQLDDQGELTLKFLNSKL